MDSVIYTKSYSAPDVNYSEILRYAGIDGNKTELEPIITECIDEIRDKLIYKVCYRHFNVTKKEDCLDLDFMTTSSKTVQKGLEGCNSFILFSATIGIEIDRLTYRYATTSPTKALFFQAIGAERIESLCDCFCKDIAKNYDTKPRFSAGYGDFPLEAQKDIFLALDCWRRIGVSLNDSILMSPSKSVTAIIGVKNANT